MIASALFLAASTLAVRAQDLPTQASENQLDSVENQYENSGFDEALPDSQSFNIDLDAEALLDVSYGGQLVELGQDYSADEVSSMPNIWVTPTEDNAENFASSNMFTLMLADASAVGGPDPEGDFRHYLANGVTFMDASGDDNLTQAIDLSQATVITEYAGPGPLENSGTHRYAWLLFEQGDDFSAPDGLNMAGAGADHWNVSSYVEQSNLGDLVAASFFTVTADGTASFSQGSTSAAASTSGGASGATSSPSPSGSSEDGDDDDNDDDDNDDSDNGDDNDNDNDNDNDDSDDNDNDRDNHASDNSSAAGLKLSAATVALGAAAMAIFA